MGLSTAAALAPELEAPPEGSSREARIAELRESYRQGRYQIDAAELSARILDAHLYIR